MQSEEQQADSKALNTRSKTLFGSGDFTLQVDEYQAARMSHLSRALDLYQPSLQLDAPPMRSKSQEIESKIVLGICAMAKKIKAKPMTAILRHLQFYKEFEIIIFEQELIDNQPIENWPGVDALIAFYSNGLPYNKVMEYVRLRQPFMVNDLEAQSVLFDRRVVYDVLGSNNVPVNDFVVIDWEKDGHEVTETREGLTFRGQQIDKPFVEKPIDADDHNIYIYYGPKEGFGSTRLHRKTFDKCSVFVNEDNVRRDGCYIYEKFLKTEGFDIKVYAIGTNYFHAEARKAPFLDGIVKRNKAGKEQRFPVLLSREEKEIARRVIGGFSQFICGFDILRTHEGTSFVCDVNGWSFVKGNAKYYADCAHILRNWMCNNLRPEWSLTTIPKHILEDIDVKPDHRPCIIGGSAEELRSVVGIFRHGDRTPKQKLKMITTEPLLLKFFRGVKKDIKIKQVEDLEEILAITDVLLSREDIDEETGHKVELIKTVLSKDSIEGICRKAQMKPLQIEKQGVTKALFILKWGGTLTHAGVQQAREVGEWFRRNMYPGDNDGFLRLHSTYRHDLKCYSSDEGRCQITAAAFLSGLLQLESEINPILLTMVTSDEPTVMMLDDSKPVTTDVSYIKVLLDEKFNSQDSLEDILLDMHVELSQAVMERTKVVKNCKQELDTIRDMLLDLSKSLTEHYQSNPNDKLCNKESIFVVQLRWQKLLKSFYLEKKDKYDITKISTVRDFIKYDLIHNESYVHNDQSQMLYSRINFLADLIMNIEQGLSRMEQHNVARRIVQTLLTKLMRDLTWWVKPGTETDADFRIENNRWFNLGLDTDKTSGQIKSAWRHVRTRLYFTSLSHLNALLIMMKAGAIAGCFESLIPDLDDILSLDYLCHFVLRLYEDFSTAEDDPKRFRLEIKMNEGMKQWPHGEKENHVRGLEGLKPICLSMTLPEFAEFAWKTRSITRKANSI